MSEIELSRDQQDAVDAVCGWADDPSPPIFKVGGYAGTGKTTVLGHLAGTWATSASPRPALVAYVAYTGRASSLLARRFRALGIESTRKTRLPASMRMSARAAAVCYAPGDPEEDLPFVGTIHRLLYRPIIDPVTEELRGWTSREQLDRDYDLIVIDEASMISGEVLEDVRRFGVPILAVGDHGQLPPVMSKGVLMLEPDVRLEKIHRQVEGNPIIALAHHLRTGGLFREFKVKGAHRAHIAIVNKREAERVLEESLPGAGLDNAIISYTNRVRVRLNSMSRTALGLKGPPRKGDLVVALKNYPPVCNGMRGRLTRDGVEGYRPWHLGFGVEFPEEEISEEILANAAQFSRDRPFGSIEELAERGIDVDTMSAAGQLYDWGYALTCHKMQGSSAAHIVVYLDRPEDVENDDYRRWIYTAVTRSSDRVTILR